MRHRFDVRVGPVAFRVGSAWRGPVEALRSLYGGYATQQGVPHFTVTLQPTRAYRRWVRPAVAIGGDHVLPGALPLPLDHALLAAEMGMNLQVALGERRYLLLHAAAVERNGSALILTGDSGSGKSTLSALLAASGWRFMGDEFVLLEPASGMMIPFPRPISLKNESIAILEAELPDARFGARLVGTPKGDIRHLRPDEEAIAAMGRPAEPRAILFPRYGPAAAMRPVAPGETFVRLTQASTNYTMLGERGFEALTRLVTRVPAVALDYPDTASALKMVEAL